MKANLIQVVFFRSAEARRPFERSLGRNAVILEKTCDLPWALPPGTDIRLVEGLVVRIESIELDLSSGWLKVELHPTTRRSEEDFEAAWKEYEAAGFKRVAGPEPEEEVVEDAQSKTRSSS